MRPAGGRGRAACGGVTHPMLLDTDEGGCLRALAKNAYDTAIEQRMASAAAAAAAAQSRDRDDASPEPVLQGRPPPQRRRRLRPAPKAKAAAKARDACSGGDGPCVRVRELFGSEGSRDAVLPPGLRLTLHSAPPTKAEARVARRLRREEREANQWNRKAAVRRMADVDVVALVATLDGCSPAQACTPSPSRAAAGAAPVPAGAAAACAAAEPGHSCLDLSQLSFRKLRDALGSRRRVRGRGGTGGVDGGGGGVPGCGTRIAPSVRVAAMIERRCESAPASRRPTAAPPSPSPQQPLPQEMQPLPQPDDDDGDGGGGNAAAPADDEACVLPAAHLPGTPPLAAKKPPTPPPPPPSASDGADPADEAPSPAAESDTAAADTAAASGGGGGGAARSALHESPEERRERERQQMHAAQQARVYGVGEFQRLPLPLETWVPAADLPRTAARLGSVGSDLKQGMEERRTAGLQRLRQLPGKPYRIPPRTSVLGVTCVAEWRLMNRKLVGAAVDATEALCNKGAPPLTENERLKMPLPQHLAYRTKGGLRNC